MSDSKHDASAAPDAPSNARRMGLAALMLSAGILLSRLLGYLREAVIAYQQGAGVETDAYNAAFLLPDLMNYFLAGGTLSITFIPLFSSFLAKDREADGWRLFSVIATVMGAVLITGIVVAEFLAPTLVPILFPGFGAEATNKTVDLTRIVLPCQFFHYIGGLVLATLMAKGRFAAATLAPLVYNGAIVAFGLVLGPSMGMAGFAIGALIGSVLGPFALSLWLARDILRFRPSLRIRGSGFARYLVLSVPLMLGVSLMTVDEWLGRIIGSSMETGTISWLNYGRRLMLVPIAIIGQAAGQAALPFLSRLAAEARSRELAELLTTTLHYVILLGLVAGGLMVALAEPTIAVIYEHGAFTADDTRRTARVLELFALGIAAWGVQLVASRAFYAEQNTWMPMVISSVVTALSIPVYIALGAALDAPGLALASTIGMTMQATATLSIYALRNRELSLRPILRSIMIGALLGVAAGGTAWAVSTGVAEVVAQRGLISALLRGGLGGIAGVAVGGAIASRLIPDEWRRFAARLGRLRKRLLRR